MALDRDNPVVLNNVIGSALQHLLRDNSFQNLVEPNINTGPVKLRGPGNYGLRHQQGLEGCVAGLSKARTIIPGGNNDMGFWSCVEVG